MKYYEVLFTVNATGTLKQDTCDLLASVCGEIGFEAFEETDGGMKGYVQTGVYDEEGLRNIVNDFPIDNVEISYNISEAENKDWNEQWEQAGFEPITVKDICCIHDGRHLPQNEYPLTVEINARQAFGTGTHETTRMMVATLLETELSGKKVLDCGCGTGILGIVSLKLGAACVLGYDIDEWSVENTLHNAAVNKVSDSYEVRLGDAGIIKETANRYYDVVLANINRNILLNYMEAFKSAMADNGILMLSGFYKEDSGIIEQEANRHGMTLVGTKTENGWCCMTFRN